MNMQSFFLSHKTSRIHYLLGGTGDRLLVCFHGYGESAASFAFLEGSSGKDFTILAIDLPFHGKTDWNEGLFFDPQELISLIGQMAAKRPGGDGPSQKGDHPSGYQPERLQQRTLRLADGGWWLMGYSMGGRVALSLLEKIPEKVEKLILLAPDGLKVNVWYWLTTQTRVGNTFFRWTMQSPGWFFLLLRAGNALKLVNRSVYKFTRYHIDHVSVRNDLYRRWTTLRGFRPDIRAIQFLVRERNIPVRLLYGQHDRIIRPERGEKFKKGIGSCCRLILLPVGHQLLQVRNLEAILDLLKD
jgi:pimeloyl-ACP methyl ester carboxylesterase